MTRLELKSISIGQTGLYSFGPSCPVDSMEPVMEDIHGKAFRYVRVTSATGNATIGFIVAEGESL